MKRWTICILILAMLLLAAVATTWIGCEGAMMDRFAQHSPHASEVQPAPLAANADSPANLAVRRERLDEAYDHIYEQEYPPALSILNELADSSTGPSDPLGAEVFFWLGYSRQETADKAGARQAYRRVLQDWPRSRYAERATALLEELEQQD